MILMNSLKLFLNNFMLCPMRSCKKYDYGLYKATQQYLLRKSSNLNQMSGKSSDPNNSAYFGFEKVSSDEKQEKVQSVFTRVASKYDLMNDVMSGGVHRFWKDYFIEVLGPVPGTKLLDVAGGTGDIAFRFLQAISSPSIEEEDKQGNLYSPLNEHEAENTFNVQEREKSSSHVVILDINAEMLSVCKERARTEGVSKNICCLQGNAEELPFSNDTFDAYTIAFGIRNVVHIEKALSEAHRVLRPGGRFLCLEFSQVTNPVLERLYDWYSLQIIPVMGQLIARDWKSYQYLVESIRKFPDQEDFLWKIEEAGFHMVSYTNLMCGVAAIHSGFKL